MIKRKRLQHAHPAQAIVEFALIITVLLMIIFIIIESGRILWAWNQVQNAAREGARYAITGQEEINCPIDGMPKFDERLAGGPRYACKDPGGNRAGSIIARTHDALSGLRLNETSTAFEDDNYYNIEVWGLNEFEGTRFLEYDFGGLPNEPVIVRVTYQVPIITPLLRPIAQRVPVFGQVTLNNESFGQQTSETAGQGLPPVVPPPPTAGVTPSPTPSPTPTDTPTMGPSLTPTNTSTPENTPTATVSICPTRFEGPAIAGTTNVIVTGDPGTQIEVIDIDTGATLGVTTLQPIPDHLCDGFADFISAPHLPLTPALVAGHLLLVRNLDDGSFDETFVIGGTPTNTPTATNTPAGTPTASNTPTATPTHTPSSPYIIAFPNCSNNADVSFTLAGFNWPANEDIKLYWDTIQFQETVYDSQHTGSFTRIWKIKGLVMNTTYTIRAVSQNGTVATFDFTTPCTSSDTPTPTIIAPTPTPRPADLVMISPPTLLSAPPINAYTPVDFSVVITNVGDIDINQQFFVDLYFDPTGVLTSTGPDERYILPDESVGFVAVSGIASGEVQTLTLKTNRGFENVPDPHDVYGMVDSVNVPGGGQISEPDETNNVSNPLSVAGVIPQNTPTPTPTFDLAGSKIIAGVVQSRIISWVPQQRADVYLYDTNLGQVVARMQTDENGFYLFDNVPDSTYTVYSCLQNTDFFGLRTGIVPTNPVTNIYMLPDHPGGCNLTPPSNTLPAVTNPGSQTNYVGDTVSLTIAATDADGDTLTYSATGLPSGLSINTNTGEISGTLPQGSQGVYSVSVNVYDGQDSTSVFFIWTVLNVKLEAKLVNSVTTTWKTVSLSNSYDSMVVVCTVRYAANTAPIVPRVRNASGSSFQVRLQNPGDNDTPTTSSVYCLVVEEGTWRLPDGRKLEAQKVNSTITDNAGSWVGQIVSYNQSYTNPVVLGQVMTFNDSRWSTFWSRANSSQKDPADSGSIRVGKHIGDDSDTARNNETIGFIVIEAGHGTVDGVEYEFQLGGDSIGGAGNNGSNTDTYNFTNGFSNTPVFGVLSQAAMDGSDGSWAVLKTSTPFTKTVLELVVDEDQIGDNERNHTNEQVGYAVFDDLIVLNGLEK